MPQEETAAFATPAERRRRRTRSLVVLTLFITVVLAGLAATVLAVNDGRNYRRLLHATGLDIRLAAEVKPAPRLQINRQRRLIPGSTRPVRLLAAPSLAAGPLLRPVGSSAEDRCRALSTIGGEAPDFRAEGLDWECIWLDNLDGTPDSDAVFVQAKGQEPDGLRTFRIKTSFLTSAEDRRVEDTALAAIDRYGLPLSGATRDYLETMIRAHRPFRSTLEDYKAQFNPEMLDPRRFNLLLVAQADEQTCPQAAAAIEPARRRSAPLPLACLPFQQGRSFSLPL